VKQEGHCGIDAPFVAAFGPFQKVVLTRSTRQLLDCLQGELIDNGFAGQGMVEIDADLVTFHRSHKSGYFLVPSGPGLGVEIDEEKLLEYTKTDYLEEQDI